MPNPILRNVEYDEYEDHPNIDEGELIEEDGLILNDSVDQEELKYKGRSILNERGW